MSSSWSGLLSIAHGGTSIVVFIKDGGSLLGDAEVPQNTAYEENHFSSVVCGHKFGFCGGASDCWLEFTFVRDGASCETNDGATK